MFETPEHTIQRIVTGHTLDQRRRQTAQARLLAAAPKARSSGASPTPAPTRAIRAWPWRFWRARTSS